MPKIEANLDAGLNTQDDPKRVGFNGFTELQNVRHVNGKLIKRFGTGTQSANITGNTSCEIIEAESIVNRRLSGVRIEDANNTGVLFTGNSLSLTGTINTTTVVIPPGTTTDFNTIFKAGDTVTVSTSAVSSSGGACANKDKAFVIQGVGPSTLTFKSNDLTSELINNNGAGGESIIISHIFDRNDDGDGGAGGTPNNLQITDANSLDGRALVVTHKDGTAMEISLLNLNDYGDLDTIKSITNASDMHIRTKVYTDAVRFACGLEHSPLIFQYINRHHFNGMLQYRYNVYANTVYPTWHIDTSVPAPTSAYSTEFKRTPKFIAGGLNLRDNIYDYKIVPIYDGVQEGLLEEAIIGESSALVSNRPIEKSGILSLERSCIQITTKIDLKEFNPRTSGFNVYRSTNGGTYYKIKTIYAGNNDPNQEDKRLYGGKDILFFNGNTTPSSNTFNSIQLIVDGFRYNPADNDTVPDFDSTGFNLVNIDTGTGYAADFNILVNSNNHMNHSYYGSSKIKKFNHESKDTETIFADNGECTGGSANGGWYFAGSEIIDTINNATDYDPNTTDVSIGLVTNDTSTAGPFATAFSTSNSGNGSNSNFLHLKFTHDGSPNEDMRRFNLGGTNPVFAGTEYIISGWIRADGFNRTDASWRLFVHDTALPTDSSGEIAAMQDIAQGKGGENQNIDKWRWFQYTITPSSVNVYMYIYMNVIGDIYDNPDFGVYVKALSVRPSMSSYTLNDRCTAFLGTQIGMSNELSNLSLPAGVLKGNSIQDDDDNNNHPTNLSSDRSIITDNLDCFLSAERDVPSVELPDHGLIASPTTGDTTPSFDNFYFSKSNYQFYAGSTGAAAANDRYVYLDFYDPGLPDGARHPYETATSSDVKYKYATILNGRQFVANVKISGSQQTEEYPNFVMYSESGSPDLIPTTNFIKLEDLQGGEIVGIETLMSDLVVFMTKGIFRISIPNGDPTNWSLVEAHPNIGCLHDRGITKVPNGIFFLSQEDVIFLDSGFRATQITYPIRDDYQATVASNSSIMRTHYDVKYNRIIITKNVSSNTEFYVYDILKQTWSTELHTGVEYDEFALDNNNNTLLIESSANGSGGGGNKSFISKAVDTSEYRDDNGSGTRTAIEMIAKTGEQELTSYDQNAYIRRVNTNTNDGGSTNLDLQVVANSTVNKNNYLDGAQSTRTSQRAQKVQVKISDNTNQDNVKEISKIEVEYE